MTDHPDIARSGVRSAAIVETLEREIASGAIAAGAKLDETRLAARFGVSRTPVREALQTLVTRSLAERIPYRGIVAADFSAERIDQLFEAMSEIEGLCGRLAAGKMTAADRSELQQRHAALNALMSQGNYAAYAESNDAFHDVIHRGAHNAEIAAMAQSLRLKLAPFRGAQLQSAERVAASAAEHQAIVDAILTRDGPAAERLLRAHLLSSGAAFLAVRGG